MKPVKTSKKLILAFAAAVAMGGFTIKAQAQTIYSDSLTGVVGFNDAQVYGTGPGPGGTFVPDPVNGSTPDTVDTGGFGGTSGATWIAAASWQRTQVGAGAYYANTNSGDNAYLPFTPEVGDSYVLSATLEKPGNLSSGRYPIEIGFVGSDPLQTGNNFLFPADRLATVQMNWNENNAYLSTDGNSDTAITPYDDTSLGSDSLNLQLTLTAAGTGWNVSVLATDASTDATVFSFASTALLDGADISYLGFSATNNDTLIEDLSLTAVVAAPEPSTWAEMGLGVLALGAFHRRRMANGASA